MDDTDSAAHEQIVLPGGRDVRGILDVAGGESTGCLVVCPPHPHYGGDRHDPRGRAVGEGVLEQGKDCLRIDYGPWDEGRGEQVDVETAIEWARDRYDRVAVFGYSFGATMALLAAAATDVDAVSVLAPSGLSDSPDTKSLLESLDCPVQVIYGEHDATVEWEPIVETARARGFEVIEFPDDHSFTSNMTELGARVGEFVSAHLAPPR